MLFNQISRQSSYWVCLSDNAVNMKHKHSTWPVSLRASLICFTVPLSIRTYITIRLVRTFIHCAWLKKQTNHVYDEENIQYATAKREKTNTHFDCHYIRAKGRRRKKNMAFNCCQHTSTFIQIFLRLVLTPAGMVKFEMSHKTTWQCYALTTCITLHLTSSKRLRTFFSFLLFDDSILFCASADTFQLNNWLM